ncbi:MAG TPA: hypothetical protein VKU39_11650 [Streptosporangiaceae bacterium]|nr:hypothetical protein [Streptosporangiaceae bacterium]
MSAATAARTRKLPARALKSPLAASPWPAGSGTARAAPERSHT